MTIGGSLVTLSESALEKSTYYYDYSLSNFAYSLIVLKYFLIIFLLYFLTIESNRLGFIEIKMELIMSC